MPIDYGWMPEQNNPPRTNRPRPQIAPGTLNAVAQNPGAMLPMLNGADDFGTQPVTQPDWQSMPRQSPPGSAAATPPSQQSAPLFTPPAASTGPALPRIFNGDVEQDANNPISRSITDMQDSLFRQNAMRQDLVRQLQGVGGIPGTSEAERQALRGGMIGQFGRSMGVNADTVNMGNGLFTPEQRREVGNHGMDPRLGGGSVGREVANRERQTDFTISGQAGADQIFGDIIRAGGSTANAARSRSQFLAGRPQQQVPAAGSPPQAVAPTSLFQGNTPPTQQTTRAGNPDVENPLDQHLENSMMGAGALTPEMLNARNRGAGQNLAPLVMAAATNERAANDAITNFVSAITGSGHLTRESLPQVMNYMVQHFGTNHVNRWFQQGTSQGGLERIASWFGGGPSTQQSVARSMAGLMNQPDAQGRSGNIGWSFLAQH